MTTIEGSGDAALRLSPEPEKIQAGAGEAAGQMTGTNNGLALLEASLAITGDWSYDDCVAAVRRAEDLVGRAKSWRCWYLGDLAAKVETTYADHSLDEFAGDIGVAYETLKSDRTVARAWESGIRIPNLPWAVHQVLASQDDRAVLIGLPGGWTTAQARQLVQWRAEQKGNREIANRPAPDGTAARADPDGQRQRPSRPPMAPAPQSALAARATALAPATAPAEPEVQAEPAAVVTVVPGR